MSSLTCNPSHHVHQGRRRRRARGTLTRTFGHYKGPTGISKSSFDRDHLSSNAADDFHQVGLGHDLKAFGEYGISAELAEHSPTRKDIRLSDVGDCKNRR